MYNRRQGITSRHYEYTCREEQQILMRNLCMCVYVCVHIYICIYVCVCMCVCIYIYMCVCVCVCNHRCGRRFFYTPNLLGRLCGPPHFMDTVALPGKKPTGARQPFTSIYCLYAFMSSTVKTETLPYIRYMHIYIYILLRHV